MYDIEDISLRGIEIYLKPSKYCYVCGKDHRTLEHFREMITEQGIVE